MNHLHVFLLVGLAACGGELTSDVDAGLDATFDVNGHWGECCDQQLGGLGSGSSCLDGGNAQQCSPTQYCGVDLKGGPPKAFCCGHFLRADGEAPRADEIDQQCPPFPGFIDRHWGECCYTHDNGLNPFIHIFQSGGIPGACDPNAAEAGVQCSPNQYCGQVLHEPTTTIACCGDRNQEKSTASASGFDPNCPISLIVP